MSVASCIRQNYMATPTTHDIDQSARNYTFHSSVTSVRFSKCDWLTVVLQNNTTLLYAYLYTSTVLAIRLVMKNSSVTQATIGWIYLGQEKGGERFSKSVFSLGHWTLSMTSYSSFKPFCNSQDGLKGDSRTSNNEKKGVMWSVIHCCCRDSSAMQGWEM